MAAIRVSMALAIRHKSGPKTKTPRHGRKSFLGPKRSPR